MKGLFTLLSILAMAYAKNSYRCSSSWSSASSASGQKVYHLITTNQMNWWKAHNYCRQNGFELATIDSQEQYDVVINFLTAEASQMNSSPRFVFGAWDAGATPNNFTSTTNGRVISYADSMWAQGEPNNAEPFGEDVAQLSFETSGSSRILVLNDVNNLTKSYVFCESDANILRDFGATNVYYHVERSLALNWFDANRFCRNHNMRLASIQSQTEYDKFTAAVRGTGDVEEGSLLGIWTSGNNIAQAEDSFTWFSNGQELSFTDWGIDQPDYSGDEACLVVMFGTGETQSWEDAICTATYPFVCELRY